LSFLLTNMRCDVDSATNGKDALALINEHNYDWLFIDIRMQPMDGIELVTAIRQLDSYQSAPIIACTAHTSDEEFRLLIDAGFDKVTHKPIMEQQIKALKDSLFGPANDQSNSTEQASLCVFNIDQAISKTDGNIKNARRIFELFFNEIEQAITVKNKVADDHLENIIDFIHRLHGAAAMTGTSALKNQLNQCETILKNLSTPSNPTNNPATRLSDTTDSTIKKELEDVYQQIGLVLEWYKNNDMNDIFETSDH
ncbi:MAG: Hpt domain-containing response regulator, partial [Pseudomonadales bacterium]